MFPLCELCQGDSSSGGIFYDLSHFTGWWLGGQFLGRRGRGKDAGESEEGLQVPGPPPIAV